MEPGPAGDAGLDILDDGGDVDLDDVMEAAAIRVYLVTAQSHLSRPRDTISSDLWPLIGPHLPSSGLLLAVSRALACLILGPMCPSTLYFPCSPS